MKISVILVCIKKISFLVCFFFQAEDGIRDWSVTGVQTCALPICLHVAMHEAALVDYAAMVLDQKRPGLFKADLTPWSDGIRVKTAAPFLSPWRTLQIATSAPALVN